jgi:hypothetical protein
MPRTAWAALRGFCYQALNRGNARAQVSVLEDADLGHGYTRADALRAGTLLVPVRRITGLTGRVGRWPVPLLVKVSHTPFLVATRPTS